MIDFFGLKKKKIEKQNIEENTTGIIARTMPDMDRNGTWIYNIFLNGILNFMVVYSTIMLVINAFDIEMNTAAFSLILIIFCIFESNRIHRYRNRLYIWDNRISLYDKRRVWNICKCFYGSYRAKVRPPD